MPRSRNSLGYQRLLRTTMETFLVTHRGFLRLSTVRNLHWPPVTRTTNANRQSSSQRIASRLSASSADDEGDDPSSTSQFSGIGNGLESPLLAYGTRVPKVYTTNESGQAPSQRIASRLSAASTDGEGDDPGSTSQCSGVGNRLESPLPLYNPRPSVVQMDNKSYWVTGVE